MLDKNDVCQKIIELYPDIGSCDMDIDAFYSTAKGTWIIELKKEKDHYEKLVDSYSSWPVDPKSIWNI